LRLDARLRAPARLMQAYCFDHCYRKGEESKQAMTFSQQEHSIVAFNESQTGAAP
jgi:hypothetical protein